MVNEFVTIMDQYPDKFQELLDILHIDIPKSLSTCVEIYRKGDKKDIDKLFKDYESFDKELEDDICKRLHTEKFQYGCFNFLDVAKIEYNAFDMKDVLLKIVENRKDIIEALRKRGKITKNKS